MKVMLTARSGFTRGASWPVESDPIVIGRSNECDVVIDDASVSRRHCQVSREGTGINLVDLGGKNPVTANEKSITSTVLQVGDEFTVGQVTFLITASASALPDRKSPVMSDTTRTLSMQEVSLSDDVSGNGSDTGWEGTAEDHRFLFRLGRKLSLAASVEELYAVARAVIGERFARSGTSFWDRRTLVWRHVGGEPWEECPDQHTAFFDSALEQHRAILTGSPGSASGEEVLLVAPLSCARSDVGVCATRMRQQPENVNDDDLTMFAAICELIGPYLHSADRGDRLAAINRRLAGYDQFDPPIIGDSKSMRAVRSEIREAAATNLNVLLQGETGTGKELVAQAIHAQSSRSDKPYIVINCAAVPNDLFESELFGHVRGAFTGAGRAKAGLIKLAGDGIIFFDEIGDLSTKNQARILRVIENGTYRPLGDEREHYVDVRVIAATNKLLPVESFRDDLYYRLAGVVIELPSLRKRPSDIPGLAQYFIDRLAGENPRLQCTLSTEAADAMRSHRWPGNVRELRHAIERAAHLCCGGEISASHLAPAIPLVDSGDEKGPLVSLDNLEQAHIARVLKSSAGNMSKTAQVLGISRSTLYQKVAEYGLRN